jgi:hypothetical protein
MAIVSTSNKLLLALGMMSVATKKSRLSETYSLTNSPTKQPTLNPTLLSDTISPLKAACKDDGERYPIERIEKYPSTLPSEINPQEQLFDQSHQG